MVKPIAAGEFKLAKQMAPGKNPARKPATEAGLTQFAAVISFTSIRTAAKHRTAYSLTTKQDRFAAPAKANTVTTAILKRANVQMARPAS